MKEQSVKLKDIAQEAGVSVAAVSAALNGTGRISDTLRTRITEVARRMNYEPNLAAKLLKQKHCPDIGLVVCDLPRRIAGSGFFQPMIYHFIQLCDAEGIRCQIEYHDPTAKNNQVPNLMAGGFAGGVLYGGAIGDATAAWLAAHASFPIVAFEDAHFANTTHSRYDLGAYRAIQHLAALGHQRIALLAGGAKYEMQNGIRAGFRKAVADFQLNCEGLASDHVFLLEGDTETMREGVAFCRELLRRPDRPTALFASDARLAKAALFCALTLHLEVPRDLSIFACGTNYEAEQVYPALSSICWNAREAIFRTYHQLQTLMDGRIPPEPVIELEPLLTLRDSVARVPETMTVCK